LLAQSLSTEAGIPIECHLGLVGGTPLTHLLLYQIAREALANVVRHSQAGWAQVRLEETVDAIQMVVEDDGHGFQPSLVDGTTHFGLQLMRERVELAGGTFIVETSPQTGTRLVVRVPIERLPSA
jgi:signal transduction histidine kinase